MGKLNGYETFQLHHAICLHFTTDYDFFKYQGKTNVTPNAWYKRNDKYHFEKLGQKYTPEQLIGIFVSYYVKGLNQPRPWGRTLLEHADTDYKVWVKEVESLQRSFKRQLLYLKNYSDKRFSKFSHLFTCKDGQIPEFVHLIVNQQITYEFVLVFDKLTKIIRKIDDKIDDDLVWPEVKTLLENYRPFLDIDKKKYRKILDEVFE